MIASLPDPLFLGAAFGVGGGAQHVLRVLIARFGSTPAQSNQAGGN
jgi:hypothetical protein